MIKDQKTFKGLPAQVQKIARVRDAVWTEFSSHLEACDTCSEQVESFASGKSTDFPSRITLPKNDELLAEDLSVYGQLAKQIDSNFSAIQTQENRIAVLQDLITENQQVIAGKRALRKKLLIAGLIIIVVVIAAVFYGEKLGLDGVGL